MTASMPWVKIYTEMLDDPKIGRLSDILKWRFIQLVLYAGELDQEGYLPYNLEDAAWRLRMDISQLMMDLQQLEAARLIHKEEMSGCWIVTAFSKRQGRTQEEKREQWREAQKRRRGVDWDDTPDTPIDDTSSAPDETHTSVINDTSMSHTPREEKRREEEIRDGAGAPEIPPPKSNGHRTAEGYKQEILEAIQKGSAAHQNLLDRWYTCFHTTPNFETKSGKTFIGWLKNHPKGESLETFALWWYSRWPGNKGQPPTLNQVQELWPQAFIVSDESEPEMGDGHVPLWEQGYTK